MWYWNVSYKDFAGEWVLNLKTHDPFKAMDRFDWWQRFGHASKIEAFKTVKEIVTKDDGVPDESISGL
jgi:hypothetical protein